MSVKGNLMRYAMLLEGWLFSALADLERPLKAGGCLGPDFS